MDKLLDFIEKYKVAILATLLIHMVILVSSNFVLVKNFRKLPPPEVDIEIPLDDIEFTPEMQEILDLNKNETPANSDVKNMASDANDNRNKSYEDYSSAIEESQSKEDIEQSVKDLEAQYFREWADNNPRADEAENMEKHELKDYSNKTKSSTSSANAYAGEVMISYNLSGRKAYSLPNPGYTCNGNGTVVVEIKVDKSGEVKEASYKSGSASECMIQRAVMYAKKSRFNSGSGMQTGTITYKFIEK